MIVSWSVGKGYNTETNENHVLICADGYGVGLPVEDAHLMAQALISVANSIAEGIDDE